MSDSDLSDALSAPLPSDSELQGALRKQVRDALKTGGHTEVTVALMRRRAEETLGLEPGFYKKSEKWKEESKRIVHEAFDEEDADLPESKPDPKPEEPRCKSTKTTNPKKRTSPSSDEGAMKKRQKPEKAARSRGVVSPVPSELSDDVEAQFISSTGPQARSKQSAKQSVSAHEKSQIKPEVDAKDDILSGAEQIATRAGQVDTSESELSVLLDEEPKSKKQKKSSAPAGKRGRKSSAVKDKSNAEVDPDQAEIKRLQSWLVKCGIRKLWGRELKPYESSKGKIKHLKEMLAEAGMTGRYSIEKANQIKEERELKADIAAVQEGAERWGRKSDAHEDVDDGRTKPKRTLVRGPPVLDFLSSDGEERD